MKDYYQILGVSSSAHGADIKRAYRQLAMRYHPDRNADPNAELFIKELNEAYDVLSDPAKRNEYDLMRQNPFRELLQEPVKPRHRDPAYRTRRPKPPGWKSEAQIRFELMQRFYPAARKVLSVSAIFCLLLLIDLLLPFDSKESKLLEIDFYHEKRIHTADVLYFSDQPEVKIGRDESKQFTIGERVTVNRTQLFRKQFNVVSKDGFVSYVPISIYRYFSFAPAILFVLAAVGILYRKNLEVTFNLGIVCFFIIFLNLYFLIVS